MVKKNLDATKKNSCIKCGHDLGKNIISENTFMELSRLITTEAGYCPVCMEDDREIARWCMQCNGELCPRCFYGVGTSGNGRQEHRVFPMVDLTQETKEIETMQFGLDGIRIVSVVVFTCPFCRHGNELTYMRYELMSWRAIHMAMTCYEFWKVEPDRNFLIQRHPIEDEWSPEYKAVLYDVARRFQEY